jgi:hypothetical protein
MGFCIVKPESLAFVAFMQLSAIGVEFFESPDVQIKTVLIAFDVLKPLCRTLRARRTKPCCVMRSSPDPIIFPVFEPEAKKLLCRIEPVANHYDVRAVQ